MVIQTNYPMRLRFLKKYLLFSFLCWAFYLSAQYHIPQKPNVLYPVYDEVGILSEEEKQQLNQKLIKFEDSTSTEIEVIIIPSTKGEDINLLATKFGQEWKIGKAKKDNGVVFLIAIEDRTMSIQQGRAVEQYLTASVSGQIIDYLVVPHFKQKNWYQGIDNGTDAIIEALQGKFKANKNKESSGFPFLVVGIILFIVILILINKNNNGGFGNDDFDDIIITRRGRRNYPGGFPSFGGGSSGGSFGGFGGGGSFGGGGASGSW